jgi:hypothetical protein
MSPLEESLVVGASFQVNWPSEDGVVELCNVRIVKVKQAAGGRHGRKFLLEFEDGDTKWSRLENVSGLPAQQLISPPVQDQSVADYRFSSVASPDSLALALRSPDDEVVLDTASYTATMKDALSCRSVLDFVQRKTGAQIVPQFVSDLSASPPSSLGSLTLRGPKVSVQQASTLIQQVSLGGMPTWFASLTGMVAIRWLIELHRSIVFSSTS